MLSTRHAPAWRRRNPQERLRARFCLLALSDPRHGKFLPPLPGVSVGAGISSARLAVNVSRLDSSLVSCCLRASLVLLRTLESPLRRAWRGGGATLASPDSTPRRVWLRARLLAQCSTQFHRKLVSSSRKLESPQAGSDRQICQCNECAHVEPTPDTRPRRNEPCRW